jgi:UDP-N-acetylglucosamine-lysosomal-enzyme
VCVPDDARSAAWLDTTHPRITVVKHSDIFTNQSHLPTFSSPAIECHLHRCVIACSTSVTVATRIPGLAPRFIYMNDDVMFGSRVTPADFATRQRGQRIYLAWAVPDCAPGCPSSWLGDGYCDLACNVEECQFDAGDCSDESASAAATARGAGADAWWNQGMRLCCECIM